MQHHIFFHLKFPYKLLKNQRLLNLDFHYLHGTKYEMYRQILEFEGFQEDQLTSLMLQAMKVMKTAGNS